MALQSEARRRRLDLSGDGIDDPPTSRDVPDVRVGGECRLTRTDSRHRMSASQPSRPANIGMEYSTLHTLRPRCGEVPPSPDLSLRPGSFSYLELAVALGGAADICGLEPCEVLVDNRSPHSLRARVMPDLAGR
jgi:hypothetical protein